VTPLARLHAAGLDATDCQVHGGFVNAHTHIYSALAPMGMPAPEPPPSDFLEILQRVWWRLDRALDAQSLRASARLYAAESLLFGTTTLIDHHESPGMIDGSLDILADACEEMGIRAALGYGATERNRGRIEAREGLEECRRFLTWRGAPQRESDASLESPPLLRGLVALHASFTVSDDSLVEAAALCRELGAPMHIHLAEDAADVADARKRGHAGPLERLLAHDALPAGSILAHGVHLDADQVRMARDNGLWIVQNPRSNRGNRVGYPGALAAADRVALGTDGYPSDSAAEIAALLEEAALHGDDMASARRRPDAGRDLAGALFGELRDACAVEKTGVVRQLIVNDRVVVRDGRLVAEDIEALRAEAAAEAPTLWERMAVQDERFS
jgi:cytosine/adenosine deaminase-related metal-dependent hydrolase